MSEEIELPRGIRALWGLEEPGRRGPKPAMTLRDIAAAGVEIADADGLDAVSMAAVAKRLGYTTMSLYRYLDSKADLYSAMLEVASGPPPADLGRRRSWRTRLRAWAEADIARLTAHPWMLEIRVEGPPLGPQLLAWTDAGMAILLDAGLDPQRAASALLTVDGFARQHVALGRQFADPEETRLWSARMRTLLDPATYPALHTVVESGALDPDGGTGDDFGFGLELLLDGIATLVPR